MDMDEAIRFHPFNPTHTLEFRNRTKRSKNGILVHWPCLTWSDLVYSDLTWPWPWSRFSSLLCTPFSLCLSGGRFTKESGQKTVLPWPLTALILPSKHSQSDQWLFKDPCWEQWVRAGVGGLWLWLWLILHDHLPLHSIDTLARVYACRVTAQYSTEHGYKMRDIDVVKEHVDEEERGVLKTVCWRRLVFQDPDWSWLLMEVIELWLAVGLVKV